MSIFNFIDIQNILTSTDENNACCLTCLQLVEQQVREQESAQIVCSKIILNFVSRECAFQVMNAHTLNENVEPLVATLKVPREMSNLPHFRKIGCDKLAVLRSAFLQLPGNSFAFCHVAPDNRHVCTAWCKLKSGFSPNAACSADYQNNVVL